MRHRNHHRPIEDPIELLPRALTKMYSMWVRRTYPFACVGRDLSVHFTSRVSRQRATRISLGTAVNIREHAWLNVATDDPAGEPTIIIDDNCVINVGSILSARNQIYLEKYVNIAQQVLIMDHNHAYEDVETPILHQGVTDGGTIRIGEGSWVGHGAAILCSRGELTIGRHCIIAANSVVMQSLPDYCVAFGIPAKIIRQYDVSKKIWRMGRVKSESTHENRDIPKALANFTNEDAATLSSLNIGKLV